MTSPSIHTVAFDKLLNNRKIFLYYMLSLSPIFLAIAPISKEITLTMVLNWIYLKIDQVVLTVKRI